MKPLVSFGIAALLLVAGLAARAEVVVQFTDPDKFTDAGDYGAERRATLDTLATYLRSLGDRYLRPGETLRIDVLDVDLAGRKHMTRRSATEVRVLTGGTDWPSMKMRYTLEVNGKVVRSAEESISDMDYLQRPGSFGHPNESLGREKTMLDDWFRSRFAKAP